VGFGTRRANSRSVNWSDLAAHAQAYVELAGAALAAACAAGIALGVAASAMPGLRGAVLALAGIGRVVPSLALLTFAIPVLGLGFAPALAALAVLATAPIVIATELGFRTVPPAVIEAAQAMGMTRAQRLLRVEWPLAFPLVYTGVRTAATEVIASAVLASFIGAGGLGEYVTTGLQANQPQILWAGVGAIAVIAVSVEVLFAIFARYNRRTVSSV
jgi:osmoprotectant transport system permease protein